MKTRKTLPFPLSNLRLLLGVLREREARFLARHRVVKVKRRLCATNPGDGRQRDVSKKKKGKEKNKGEHDEQKEKRERDEETKQKNAEKNLKKKRQ